MSAAAVEPTRIDRLRRLFDVPRFDDPVDQFRADTTGFVARTYLAGGLLVILAGLVIPEIGDHGMQPLTEFVIAVLGTTAVAVPIVALRLRRVRFASVALVAITYLCVTVATGLGGGVPSPGLFGYVLVVVTAGVLLSWPTAIAVAVGSLATVCLAFLLGQAGAPADHGVSGLSHYISSLAAIAAITAAIVVRSSQRAQTAIQRAVAQRETLEQANRELRALEARFDAIARNSREMVAEFDEGGRLVYASPNHEEVLGRSVEELRGRTAIELVHPDEAAGGGRWPRSSADPHLPHSIRVRAADDSWRWCEVGSSDYVAADGTRRWVTVSRDATLRVAAQAREIQRREAASHAQKMEAIGRLAGGITHELNNLMTVITLNVELISASLTPDRETGENLDDIRESAEHATSLIRRLLSFARPADSARTSVEVNPQVRDIGRLLQPLIGEAITFELRLDPDVGFVEADASEIGQFLMNLVVNARDAITHGGSISVRTRRVDLSEAKPCYSGALPPGSYVGIAVSDSGAGMDGETLERLFEPFFTTRAPDGGTGLGLALVYAIVRRSGGDLSVESDPSRGTTIEAFLPRLEAPALDRAPRAAEAPQRGGRETVLVVEDQERVRAATARVIRALGYRVFEAGNAEEALELEQKLDHRVDLLLTDVVMPGMPGPELARRLLERRSDMRVLYLTGFADRAFGPDGSPDHPVLIKPVGQRVLASRLRAILDGPAPGERGKATRKPRGDAPRPPNASA